jgi:hypothetical protein
MIRTLSVMDAYTSVVDAYTHVVDAYTHELLRWEADTSLGSGRVTR